jgi:enoyl-CoA hydratase
MPIEVLEQPGNVTMVVISNPAKLNALDEDMYRHLGRLWPALADGNSSAVVLTGAGGAFCSGADLAADLMSLPDVDDLVEVALLKSMFFPKPLIAAIDGVCVAGGFELALGCDIRMCTPGARFGLPEAKWGIFPSGGGARKLASEIGYARASDILMSGRIFGADEAHAMGLISAIVPAEDLRSRSLELAKRISANGPTAMMSIKRYLHESRTPSSRLVTLERQLTVATRYADTDEGVAAFMEKRAPNYARPSPTRQR